MSYTKGPWTLADYAPRYYNVYADGLIVASAHFNPLGKRSSAELVANARLIAAAPELLEAAKSMLDTLDMLTPHEYMRGGASKAFDQLKAAIEKAEGPPPPTPEGEG